MISTRNLTLSMSTGIHLMVGFSGLSLDPELKTIIRDCHVGGIVLFRRNLESLEQVTELLRDVQSFAKSALGRPLLVAIDQEGGPVQRLQAFFPRLPSAHELAQGGPDLIRQWTAAAARELRQIGAHINFAPVLDLTENNPEHFMWARSLGQDPETVSDYSEIWIESLQSLGISATAKHFPGLGKAESDPHHYAPLIHIKTMGEMEAHLAPFRHAVSVGVQGVMTSHAKYPILDSEWPATLSPRINRELLRNDMGFEGVLFSDDMDMAAVCDRYSWEEMVRQGMEASIDFFLACQQPDHIGELHEALVKEISQSSTLTDFHRESVRRIHRLLALHFR